MVPLRVAKRFWSKSSKIQIVGLGCSFVLNSNIYSLLKFQGLFSKNNLEKYCYYSFLTNIT